MNRLEFKIPVTKVNQEVANEIDSIILEWADGYTVTLGYGVWTDNEGVREKESTWNYFVDSMSISHIDKVSKAMVEFTDSKLENFKLDTLIYKLEPPITWSLYGDEQNV